MSQLTKIFLIFILAGNCYATKPPAIMVSIKPFYNICAKVMYSVGKPELLLKNNSSPHDYQLKPSDINLIQSSDLIIWGGSGIDGYLAKNIDNYPGKDLNLSKISNLNLLPIRDMDHKHEDDDDHDHDHEHGHSHNLEHYDPHFWLEPQNAVLIAEAIANRLAAIDPVHKNIYLKNAADFKNEVNDKNNIWQNRVKAVKANSFIVFHDAYQYFEKFFKLEGAGAISINPETPPSARRIQEIQKLLQQQQVKCIFSEPQFNPKIINTVSEGMHIYNGVLDPLGQDKDLGTQGYIILLDNLINNFVACAKFNPN